MKDEYITKIHMLPAHMHDGMIMYIESGVPPGSFLTAVLCNDLKWACSCADHVNKLNMHTFIKYLYRYAPVECWGSPENFDQWTQRGGLNARLDRAQPDEKETTP